PDRNPARKTIFWEKVGSCRMVLQIVVVAVTHRHLNASNVAISTVASDGMATAESSVDAGRGRHVVSPAVWRFSQGVGPAGQAGSGTRARSIPSLALRASV